jgi:hypothetical protein
MRGIVAQRRPVEALWRPDGAPDALQQGQLPPIEPQEGAPAAASPAGAVATASARLAALAAASAVGLVATAVLGDGYFEIAKHTWLAAYLLAVTGTSLVLAVVVIAASRTFAVIEPRKRRARASEPVSGSRSPTW